MVFAPLGVILPLILLFSVGAFGCAFAAYPKIKEIMIDPYYFETPTPRNEDKKTRLYFSVQAFLLLKFFSRSLFPNKFYNPHGEERKQHAEECTRKHIGREMHVQIQSGQCHENRRNHGGYTETLVSNDKYRSGFQGGERVPGRE